MIFNPLLTFAEMKTYLITFVRTCDTATYNMEESAFIFSTSVPAFAYSLHIFLHALFHWDLFDLHSHDM